MRNTLRLLSLSSAVFVHAVAATYIVRILFDGVAIVTAGLLRAGTPGLVVLAPVATDIKVLGWIILATELFRIAPIDTLYLVMFLALGDALEVIRRALIGALGRFVEVRH